MSIDREAAIHLDTSFLIRALVTGSEEAGRLVAWMEARRGVRISALAWGEFLCGPVDPDARALAGQIIRDPLPLRAEEAEEAARLFVLTGRRRGSFADCVIAATALRAGAALATSDRADFRRFADEGLRLAE